MKETLQIPTPEALEALIGKELYDIWTSLCQLIEQKYNMEQLWNHGGKNGHTNINIAKAEKRCVPYTPKNKRLASWSFR